jgi:hypothetical protein
MPVRFTPVRPMLDHLGRARGSKLGYHHGFCAGGNHDGARPSHKICRVNTAEAGIATARRVEMGICWILATGETLLDEIA